MVFGRKIASLFLLSGACFSAAIDHQSRPLPVDKLLKASSFAQFAQPQISPDGKWAAYVVTHESSSDSPHAPDLVLRTGIRQTPFSGDVYISSTEGGPAREITEGRNNSWALSWSPDGHYLAFLSDRDSSDQAKVWLWEDNTNRMRKVADVPIRADRIRWLPDSKHLIVGALPEGVTPSEYVAHELAPESADLDGRAAQGSTALVYRATSEDERERAGSHQGRLEGTLSDLALVDVASGNVLRIDRGHRISKYAPSPDGSRIAFTVVTRFEDSTTDQMLFDLVAFTIATNKREILASGIQLSYQGEFSWSPDGSQLAYQTGGPNANGDCYVVGLTDKTSRNITTLPEKKGRWNWWPPLWDSSGHNVYFLENGALWRASPGRAKADQLARIPAHTIFQLVAFEDNRLWSADGDKTTVVLANREETNESGFFSINLQSGHASQLLEDGHCFTCAVQDHQVSVSRNKLAYFENDAASPIELWATAPGFNNPHQLTHLNPELEAFEFGSSRLVEWYSLDGEKLKGALLLPAGYVAGKRYPLIVNVYGGVLYSSNLRFFGLGYGNIDNMQLFATRGYAVLLPDAPQHVGTPMLDLAKTVLPGINKIVEIGIADVDRLGIMGQSYGGYSTLSLIVQTARFKAAIMADGPGDLIAGYGEMKRDGSAYLVSSAEQGQFLMGGTPWQFRDRYIENSPFFYLDRINTPLLIIHGADDGNIAPFLSDQVFVGLRRLGKKVEYAKYVGEGHSPTYWRYANQLDYCNRALEWFDKYLKPEQHTQ
jgi:dipeptidyl aminopeptidase/acylaminoacyl peptidase